MPVKVWSTGPSGLVSEIVTDWDRRVTSEQYRPEAEQLDGLLDKVLDSALLRVAEAGATANHIPREFVKAWSIGRALRDSGFSPRDVTKIPALRNERPELLWKALASKCRTGARSNRQIDERWKGGHLRPDRAGEPRREGRRLDYFEMCRWLAEQDFNDAAAIFGGYVRNVWQMLERRALRPPALRHALHAWLLSLPSSCRARLTSPKVFPEMMKVLAKRWPDRGAGSAKRPEHYRDDSKALNVEVENVLQSFVDAGTGAPD